ncbi:MAG: type II toxin-antitoxin system VapC family toxin [Alphaproteobacteria bacterium]|nr:type II toxin-antitoxin system VapC family toxin [Alphaproteobacteria bacterium]
MFLLDTVALSELNKVRPNGGFATWFDTTDTEDLFVSVVTLGEIERGIERQRRLVPGFVRRLENWRDRAILAYGDRVLAVTIEIAQTWGRLGERKGHMNTDLLIAATALVHDLAVVTRNVRRFDGTGAKILNPFEG